VLSASDPERTRTVFSAARATRRFRPSTAQSKAPSTLPRGRGNPPDTRRVDEDVSGLQEAPTSFRRPSQVMMTEAARVSFDSLRGRVVALANSTNRMPSPQHGAQPGRSQTPSTRTREIMIATTSSDPTRTTAQVEPAPVRAELGRHDPRNSTVRAEVAQRRRPAPS
jgi:hypothetical protein